MGYSVTELAALVYRSKDSRAHEWFLMSSPMKPTALVLAYILIVVRIGPGLMKDRAPYNLKYILTIYNIFQMIFNSYLFIMVWNEMQAIRSLMISNCQIDRTDEKLLECLSFGWLYLINKVVDLFDTIFMILRKKNDQITFLHVYHHSIMIYLTWFGIKYMGVREEFGIIITINTAIHVIMYFYYLVAAMGPQYQKYLRWKIYITKIQIGQFLMAPVYIFASVVKGCQISKPYTFWVIIHACIFIYLFVDFYRKAYKKSSGIEHRKNTAKKCEKST
ncbi:very long chain fatty acid elongase 7-like isoform 1-T2 [Glossina fuscipes fuscipes]